MNTYEARTEMLAMAAQAVEIVQKLSNGAPPLRDDKVRLRSLLADARSVLADAGFPGEAVWRGLQRASIGVETSLEQADRLYWESVETDLQTAITTLEALVSPQLRRESDIYIVG